MIDYPSLYRLPISKRKKFLEKAEEYFKDLSKNKIPPFFT